MTSAVHAPPIRRAPDAVDRLLIVTFLIGIYLGVALKLPGGIPVPTVIAGATGMLLLLKHADRIAERHVVSLAAVLVLSLLSVLSAPDIAHLGERFKGFVQFSYSLLIAYGFFLVAILYTRAGLSRIFLWFCVAILVGGTLENYTAFKHVSDSFRMFAFDFGVYVSDDRDQLLYGRIRPKLFTSEPSAMTFPYTLYAFAWYVLARARLKLLVYLALLGAGYFVMRGPTLLLGFALVPIYEILLSSRRGLPGAARIDALRVIGALVLAILLMGLALFVGGALYEQRLQAILSGHDISFFARVVAPIYTAIEVVSEHPMTGAGLTAWEFIEDTIRQIYANAPGLAAAFHAPTAKHGITNYFWTHWIFLGLFWGSVLIVALSWFLHTLRAPSVLFCWATWFVFGQASGAYVDPRTWIVLLLACTVAVMHERERVVSHERHVRAWRARRASRPAPGIAAEVR